MKTMINGQVLTPPVKAASVPYDNTSSKLSGENLQEVVDELNKILNTHKTNQSNPHGITLAQIGAASETDLSNHVNNKSNPHGVTKAQLGLGNCDNTSDSAKSVKYATSAGNADTVDGHHFNWSGQSGQPSWIWGGNDSTNMYVYNPSNFSVKYATSAGSATDQSARNVASSANTNANNRVSKSGDTMTGSLSMNNYSLSNIYGVFSDSSHQIALCTNNGVAVLNQQMTTAGTLATGTLQYTTLSQISYRGAKENINSANEDRIKKILNLHIRTFDYRPGFGNGEKDVLGEIVDEVQDIIPEAVITPEDWNDEDFNELLGYEGNKNMPGIDQTRFIPYLIAMVQIQQKQIDALEQKINGLEK